LIIQKYLLENSSNCDENIIRIVDEMIAHLNGVDRLFESTNPKHMQFVLAN